MPLARGSFCNCWRGGQLWVWNFVARSVAKTERFRERSPGWFQRREIVSESQNRTVGSFWLTQTRHKRGSSWGGV